jgi:fucose 4-O-acetylase-like acetyltransferase
MTRHAHIDIAKGLGIIMVVTAHAGLPFLGQLFYCFHMPLFFVISGMLFKPAPPAAYAL